MTERTFEVTWTVTSKVKINKEVFDQVTYEWRESFYKLYSDEDIVGMVAYALLRGMGLSDIDGFANLSDSSAIQVTEHYELESVDEVN